jgi:hypothetical protein
VEGVPVLAPALAPWPVVTVPAVAIVCGVLGEFEALAPTLPAGFAAIGRAAREEKDGEEPAGWDMAYFMRA